MAQQIGQSHIQMGEAETETGLEQTLRHGTLTAEQQLGHFTESSAQDESRCRENGRAAQRLAQRPGELGVAHRQRCAGIIRTASLALLLSLIHI